MYDPFMDLLELIIVPTEIIRGVKNSINDVYLSG